MKTSQKRKRDRRRSSDRTPPLYATERKFWTFTITTWIMRRCQTKSSAHLI